MLAEYKSIESEHQLFREIKGFDIASKIERSVYNRRKRKLFPFIEEIRLKMTINRNFIHLKNTESALRLYSLNYVISL